MQLTESRKLIIDKLLKGPLETPEEIQAKYPPRKLAPGAMVTRIAPSPTGFMHIGGIYAALISERLAHQTEGVFYLRIEDTDRKREVEGATDLIVQSLANYGVKVDEGQTVSNGEIGSYGPYKQSLRESIYKTYIKVFLERGLAYPCFCTTEELEEMTEQQEAQKFRLGYYGRWAKWRDKSDEEVLKALEDGKSYVIRFRSSGDFDHRIEFEDILKGKRQLPENDNDIVIMKTDGLPTYHFAHLVDDHLMGTTDVIRGDEWFPSMPLHLELFKAMGWPAPRYGHLLPIQKMDGESRRKLSKRKDPEANMAYYAEQGYPKDAVIEYLLNLANSNFEDWRKANPLKDNREFILTIEKLSHSNGALFDFNKLNDVSKEVVARLSAVDIFQTGLDWAKKYDVQLAEMMEKNPDYTRAILNIERGVEGKPRKDIGKWSDFRNELFYFFDSRFNITVAEASGLLSGMDLNDAKLIAEEFLKVYSGSESKDEWLQKLKNVSTTHGYAESTKAFKAEPAKYKGYIADVAKIFRVLLAGRVNTPDLYSMMQVMGRDRVAKRLLLLN